MIKERIKNNKELKYKWYRERDKVSVGMCI